MQPLVFAQEGITVKKEVLSISLCRIWQATWEIVALSEHSVQKDLQKKPLALQDTIAVPEDSMQFQVPARKVTTANFMPLHQLRFHLRKEETFALRVTTAQRLRSSPLLARQVTTITNTDKLMTLLA